MHPPSLDGRDRLTRLVLVQCRRNLHPVIEVHHAASLGRGQPWPLGPIALCTNCGRQLTGQ